MHLHDSPKNFPTASPKVYLTISYKSHRRPPKITVAIFDPVLQKHINIYNLALMVLEFASLMSSKVSQF